MKSNVNITLYYMKEENRDISTVELANIPMFNRLDNVANPLRFLELFSDDVLVDMVFGYTKLYSHREKADISFEITNEKILLILKRATALWLP